MINFLKDILSIKTPDIDIDNVICIKTNKTFTTNM